MAARHLRKPRPTRLRGRLTGTHQRLESKFEELQLLIDSGFQDPYEWISRWDRIRRRDITTTEARARLAMLDTARKYPLLHDSQPTDGEDTPVG